MKMLKAKVHGKVLGVWFQKYNHGCASRFGIVGFVKSLNDGTVIVCAKGSNTEKFKKCLNIGSTDSDIDKIDYFSDTSKIEFSDLRIEYR